MHRLVCIGDSITQGFKSGAIFEPNLSYPAILAWEMGSSDGEFRYPSFGGEGGLPFNIEYVLRRLDQEFGKVVNLLEIPLAAIFLRKWMDDNEDYWERGAGAGPLRYSGHYHNLAVWGFQMQDAYQVTAELCKEIVSNPSDNWVKQVPEHAMLRTALRVLNPSHSDDKKDLDATQIARATELARDGGIENLIVFLGANNVLGTVTSLKYVESTDRELEESDPTKRKATIYTPAHFEKVLTELLAKVEAMTANGGHVQRVFWGTVPSVTIPPVSHGVGGRMDSDKGLESPYGQNDDPEWFRRYFKYYTRPWIPEKNFNPTDDPFLTGEEVMKIDRTIVRYKTMLQENITTHNRKRKKDGGAEDWFLVDTHWTLERLAFRRYVEDSSIPPPPGWSPYELPDAYIDLNLNTKFLRAKRGRRISGGIFSLDGIHPTTVGYGLLAQEFINVMQTNGVEFRWGDQQTPRVAPTIVDYSRLIQLDTLIKRLPETLDDIWDRLVDGDQVVDLFKRVLRSFG